VKFIDGNLEIKIPTLAPQGWGDRLKTITYPDSTTSTFAYDSRGRRTSVTDQNGKTTTYTSMTMPTV
jgi:YD repeat-containing protein